MENMQDRKSNFPIAEGNGEVVSASSTPIDSPEFENKIRKYDKLLKKNIIQQQ